METAELYNRVIASKGVSTDSRTISRGMTFFALKGENFNGNRFAGKALESGASWVIVDEDTGLDNEKVIVVENSLKTLQNLANHHRNQLKTILIGITGSNGKTTTKELIHRVLSSHYSCFATQGNLNNHIGVPLSLFELRDEAFAVIEMGANKEGDIAELCTIADPDEGIITNIGKAHLEGFGSMEGIRKTKTELYRHIDTKNGVLFVNGSNEILTGSLVGNRSTLISYFEGPECQCTAEILSEKGPLVIRLIFMGGGETKIRTQLPGNYNLENMVAAACIGKYHGVPEEKIAEAIASYNPDNNRSQLLDTGKNRILMDAYNANPTSMEGAIRTFADMDGENKLLIIGDMLEMGSYASEEHNYILNLVNELNPGKAWVVGTEFFKHRKKYPFTFFENTGLVLEHLRKEKVINHLVLIKASRGLKLELLRDYL